jgi:hypothetical protein
MTYTGQEPYLLNAKSGAAENAEAITDAVAEVLRLPVRAEAAA